MLHLSDLNQGWFFTLLSTCLCVLGCFIIYIDDLYRAVFPKFLTKRYKFELRDNYAFMNASLSFSSGCLTFTALYRLLPEGKSYLKLACKDSDGKCANAQGLLTYLFASYAIGMVVCLSLNALLHILTSKSVVHCNHSGHKDDESYISIDDVDETFDGIPGEGAHSQEEHVRDHQHEPISQIEDHGHAGNHGHSHEHNHEHSHEHGHNHVSHYEQTSETRPLLTKDQKSKPLLHYIINSNEVGECKGYSSADVYLFHSSHPEEITANPLVNVEVLPKRQSTHDLLLIEDDASKNHLQHLESAHHHHVSTPLSHLLLIGVETTLAITLHKLPEGFITYITSETNKTLGVQIFLSLMFHNFTEGFLMCLPLYYLMSASPSDSSRLAKFKAFAISATLGGLAQPLGALCGAAFLKFNDKRDINLEQLNFIFGITMAITSGFLTVVGLQMFSSAVSFNRGSLNFVLLWCLAGMCLIGFSSVLTANIN